MLEGIPLVASLLREHPCLFCAASPCGCYGEPPPRRRRAEAAPARPRLLPSEAEELREAVRREERRKIAREAQRKFLSKMEGRIYRLETDRVLDRADVEMVRAYLSPRSVRDPGTLKEYVLLSDEAYQAIRDFFLLDDGGPDHLLDARKWDRIWRRIVPGLYRPPPLPPLPAVVPECVEDVRAGTPNQLPGWPAKAALMAERAAAGWHLHHPDDASRLPERLGITVERAGGERKPAFRRGETEVVAEQVVPHDHLGRRAEEGGRGVAEEERAELGLRGEHAGGFLRLRIEPEPDANPWEARQASEGSGGRVVRAAE